MIVTCAHASMKKRKRVCDSERIFPTTTKKRKTTTSSDDICRPNVVRTILQQTYGTHHVYTILEFIQQYIFPALSLDHQQSILQQLLHFSSQNDDESTNSGCDSCHIESPYRLVQPFHLSVRVVRQLQILFQETLITIHDASTELKPLKKVRQPVVPPSQSLSSLVHDIIWTLLVQNKKHLIQQRSRPAVGIAGNKTIKGNSNNSSNSSSVAPPQSSNDPAVFRYSMKNILCQGFAINYPTSTTTSTTIQKQLNSATEYCSTSTFFRILHTMIFGDDILRYILLNTNIFIPILNTTGMEHPNVTVNHPDFATHTSAIRSEIAPCSTSSNNSAVYSYWQVAGVPFHHRHNCGGEGSNKRSVPKKKKPRKRKVPHVTNSEIRHESTSVDDLSQQPSAGIPILLGNAASRQTSVTTEQQHQQPMTKLTIASRNAEPIPVADTLCVDQIETNTDIEPPRHRKKARTKKRKRPLASLDGIFHTEMNDVMQQHHPLSPKACVYRTALFYSNSYTPSIGKQGLLVMESSSSSCQRPPPELMTPIQLWQNMNVEYHDFYQQQFQPPPVPSTLQPIPSASAVNMCADILRRHKMKTDHHRLLQRYCPLPISNTNLTVQLSDVVHQYSSPEGVIAFVQACVQSILPSTFWNPISNQNMNHQSTTTNPMVTLSNEWIFLHQIIPTFITLRRNERFSNKMLLQNIRVTKMTWIYQDDKDHTNNTTASERHPINHCGRTRLHHECCKLQILSICRWLFRCYIIPLLQQCFYITESEFHGKRVLYYRKPVWALFRTLSMNKLLGQSIKKSSNQNTNDTGAAIEMSSKVRKIQYVELTEADVLQRLLRGGPQMGVCRLRLVPKATGVRPIATLNKREFITPLVLTSSNTVATNTIVLEEVLDVDSLDLNDDEEVDTPLGPARTKTRRDGITGNALLTSTSHEIRQHSLPPTRIRLSNQSRASTNMLLSDIFSVLSYERDRKENSYGSGLMGMHDFYPRYRTFIKEWKQTTRPMLDHHTKQLYFGSVDIRHCYDNIDQDHLLWIIDNEILTEEHYVIQKYSVYQPELRADGPLGVKWQSKKDVSLVEQMEPFSTKVRVLAHDRRCNIFVDGVNTVVISKGHIMNQLREHLTGHMVVTKGRYGNRYLLQSTGIPQGSVLSTLLCNFYYGDVERRLLGTRYRNNGSSSSNQLTRNDNTNLHVMARMVDDFVLVSTNIDDVDSFFVTMHCGDDSLGVSINKEKTNSSVPMRIVLPGDALTGRISETIDIQTNNEMDSVHACPDVSYFSWCGMKFDTQSGEVRIDYTRFFDGKGGDTLTVDHVSCEGEHLLAQMKLFVRPRCLPILYDPIINAQKVRIVNFYQMMVYAAVKTSEYLKALQYACTIGSPASSVVPSKSTVLSNVPFLLRCIEHTIQFGTELIQVRVHAMSMATVTCDTSSKVTNSTIKNSKKPFLPHPLTMWLGWQAYYDVFVRLSNEDDFRYFADTELVHQVNDCVSSTGPSLNRVRHRYHCYQTIVQQALDDINFSNLLSS